MTGSDKFLSYFITGLIAPVCLMLALWWGSLPFLGNSEIVPWLALGGFAAGWVLDATVFRRFLGKLFTFSLPVFVLIGIFYSVMVYGFFMGVPVFNCIVGIVFGYIAVKSGVYARMDKAALQRKTKRINLFFLLVLICLCAVSAVLALNESTITSQLKGMLQLPFDVTFGMVWGIILIGGTILALLQYGIASLILRYQMKALSKITDAI